MSVPTPRADHGYFAPGNLEGTKEMGGHRRDYSRFRRAVLRALARLPPNDKGIKGLDRIAEELVLAAANREPWAILALRDSLDGRPKSGNVLAELLAGGGEGPSAVAIVFVGQNGQAVDPASVLRGNGSAGNGEVPALPVPTFEPPEGVK